MDFNLKNLCDFLVDLKKTMMFSLFIGNVFLSLLLNKISVE